MEFDIDLSEVELIPTPIGARTPWAGLQDLRMSLIQRGMIKEALHVFRAENNRTPPSERLAKVEDILAHLETQTTLYNRDLMMVEMKQEQVSTFIGMGDDLGAEQLAAECESMLRTWSIQSGNTDLFEAPIYLNLHYNLLDLLTDLSRKLKVTQQLIPYAQRTASRNHVNLLDSAAETCSTLASITGDQEHLSACLEFKERAEYEYEYVQEDIISVALHHSDITSMTTSNLVDRRKGVVS